MLTLPTNCYLKKINLRSHHRQSLKSRLTKTFDNFVSIRRISKSSPPISHLKKRINLKNFFRCALSVSVTRSGVRSHILKGSNPYRCHRPRSTAALDQASHTDSDKRCPPSAVWRTTPPAPGPRSTGMQSIHIKDKNRRNA